MPTERRIPSRKIYQTSLNSNKLNYEEKYCKGSCETTFKKRLADHKKFNNEQYKNETELSKEVCNLKPASNNAEIAWKTVQRCAPVNRAILRCSLCLKKKLEIAAHQEISLLNKRLELFLNAGILTGFYQ